MEHLNADPPSPVHGFDFDEISYLETRRPKIKLRPFVRKIPPEEAEAAGFYVPRYIDAETIESREYIARILADSKQLSKLESNDAWHAKWNADFDAAFEAYKESARTGETAGDVLDEYSDLSDTEEEREHQIRHWEYITEMKWPYKQMGRGVRHDNLDDPYPRNDDETRRVKLIEDKARMLATTRRRSASLVRETSIDLEEVD
ncbi:hypothetical protein B0H11DRAFT_2253096 [Mycena galericulata]|nr:hypothetical protein B0H11DRAFT_2253096 [Mycena galericulata]